MSGPLQLVPEEAGADWAERTMQLRLLRPRRAPQPVVEDLPELSADPIDELAERLSELCAYAVHPYEIAAFLEAEGMTDQKAALLYGRPDAFTLAEELFVRVPRRYRGSGAEFANPWRADPWRCLVRGLVFCLPGLGYLLGSDLFAPERLRFGLPSGAAALAAATLACWAWNQGLAHRAYAWLGHGRRRSAGRCLAVGGVVGALLGSASAYGVGGPAASLWFAAGQSCYVAAATVLLVLGRERILLAALAPAAVGAGVVVLTPVPTTVRTAVLLTSLLLALGLAVREVVRCLRQEEAGEAPRIPFHRQLPQVLFGLAVGAMTLMAELGDSLSKALAHSGQAIGGNPAGPQMTALSLSLGFAEWLLFRYREIAVHALYRSRSPRELTFRTAELLLLCLLCYLTVVTALDVAVTALWPGAPGPAPVPAAAVGLLGTALWLALLLNAFDLSWTVATVCTAGAACEGASMLAGVPTTTGQLSVSAAVTVALAAIAVPVLGRATKHR